MLTGICVYESVTKVCETFRISKLKRSFVVFRQKQERKGYSLCLTTLEKRSPKSRNLNLLHALQPRWRYVDFITCKRLTICICPFLKMGCIMVEALVGGQYGGHKQTPFLLNNCHEKFLSDPHQTSLTGSLTHSCLKNLHNFILPS